MDILQELIRPGLPARDLAGIPCYFDEPSAQSLHWACAAKHLLSHLEYATAEIRRQAQRHRLLELTRNRLRALGDAYGEHGRILGRILAPLCPEQIDDYDYFVYFTRNGARASELATHYPNLHRDWGWGVEENRRTFELLRSLLPPKRSLGKVLVLGAGACRLAYDLHRICRPDITVVTDINPLLFFCAQKIVSGEELELFEFPLLPIDIDSCAVKRRLRAPAAIDDAFRFVLTDATRPCFEPASFDTIVTSWFIDVAPMDVHQFFPLLNRSLRRNGTWLNVGPLMYKSQFRRLYSAEETFAIAEKAGFAVQIRSREFLPHLQSPSDCHHRTEGVVAFRAQKIDDVENLEPPSSERRTEPPAWLTDPSRPVQLSGDLQGMISAHRVAAEVLSSIDGQSGIDQIIDRMSVGLQLSREVTEAVVRRFLTGFVNNHAGNPMVADR